MKVKELVIVGEEGIGKTTLANALLGWDIFPQSTWDLYIPTVECTAKMLTHQVQLTDTPGYNLLWYQVPVAVQEAVCRADTIIMLFKGFYDADTEPTDPKEDKLLQELLTNAKTRDIYFVIPFYSEDGPVEQEEVEQDMVRAKKRFASFSDHGEYGFFCIDPMMALVAAIENDRTALETSGILPLKAALLGREE